MPDQSELESLYREAQGAIKSGEYERAGKTLKKILLVDENYRDASRLLAQLVKLKRRRWYNHPLLWSAVAVILIISLLAWLVPKISWQALNPSTSAMTAPPSQSPHSTIAFTHTPTAIPLSWKRINIGQEFSRDNINVIVFHPNDPDVIYVGTQHAGIYKSIDGGVSWQPAHRGLGGAWVSSLVIDPWNPQTLYAGVALGGVYKTKDGGSNWQPTNHGIDTNGWNWVSMVAISPSDSQILYYSQGRSFYASSDGGETWVEPPSNGDQSPFCPRQIMSLAIDPTNSAHLMAFNIENPREQMTCQEGIYESLDGGHSWSLSLQMEAVFGLHNAGIVPDGTWKNIYVTNQRSVFQSNDHGKNWHRLSQNDCHLLAADPANGSTAFCATYNKIVITKDGGETWQDMLEINRYADAITVSPHSRQTIFVGEKGLRISSDDGQTWVMSNNGLGAGYIKLGFDFFEPSALLLEDETCTVYRSTSAGIQWDLAANLTCVYQSALSNSGNLFFWIDKEDGSLRRSSDRGVTSTRMNWPIKDAIPETLLAYPVERDGLLTIFGFESPFFFNSDDQGETWHGASLDGWGPDDRSVGPTAGAFFSPNQGNQIYVVSAGDDVFRSDNAGETWQICTSTDTFHSTAEHQPSMIVHPADANHILLATRGLGILVSKDGCKSWQSSNTGLNSMSVNILAIDPNNPDTLYAGTDGGAYISFDGGETWGEINDGLLGATVVYSIVVDKDSNVYAATPYGIFILEGK